MGKWSARASVRYLSLGLILALLVLVSGFASAQHKDVTTYYFPEAKLTASDGAEEDHFGASVSISADTLVVGASWDQDNGKYSGSAYLFERDAGGVDNWGQVAKLTASDGTGGELFGISASISGFCSSVTTRILVTLLPRL